MGHVLIDRVICDTFFANASLLDGASLFFFSYETFKNLPLILNLFWSELYYLLPQYGYFGVVMSSLLPKEFKEDTSV